MLLREEEFVRQESALGARIHLNHGVWWRESPRFYCKPVFEFKALKIGRQRPKWRKSALGYKHCVPDGSLANQHNYYMILAGEDLRNFDISHLKPRKRSVIRKAMKELEFNRISDIDQEFGAMRDMAVTAAKRIGRGHSWRYYVDHELDWRAELARLFALPFREWWGVYSNNRLIAYNHSFLVEDTMVISAVKSHSDFLKEKPNDFLLFRFIEYCQTLPDCRRIIFGGWTLPESQNAFKENYGFRKTAVPMYISNKVVIDLARRLVKSAKSVRQVLRRGVPPR